MLASTDDLNKKLTVEQFYNDRTRMIGTSTDFDNRPGGMTPTVFMQLVFGDMPEKDRVYFTCVYGAYLWGLMERVGYDALRNNFIATCAATIWTTNVPERVRAAARMMGKPDPALPYIQQIKDQTMPLAELQSIVRSDIISGLLRADASDPDMRYLQTLVRDTDG